MEKRHLEIPVNSKHQDCIISHFMKAIKDINGNVKWVNEWINAIALYSHH